MYLSFYNLKHKPFQISTDPRFLWLGEKHEEALATLRYGILDNKGFLLLTGDAGTGKTTLINTLLKTLGDNTLVASIRDPDLDPMDFYNYTAHAFGLVSHFTTKGSFLIQFEQFLHDTNSAKKKALLIIDEAQRINQELLEEVRLLSNIEREDRKLLNIFFVGQLEFNEILLRKENRAIRQRITVNYNIPALTRKETGQYINHRMKVAGEDKEYSFGYLPEQKKDEPANNSRRRVFSDGAIKEIYLFSKGYPRLINVISDRSLLTGFVEESKTITTQHVKECVKELQIPEFTLNKSAVPDIDEHYKKIAIAAEHPPESAPAIPPLDEKKDVKYKTNARKTLMMTGVLILLVLGYFTLSKNGVFQGDAFTEFMQGFRQPTDTMVNARKPRTETKTLPKPEPAPQPKTVRQPAHQPTPQPEATPQPEHQPTPQPGVVPPSAQVGKNNLHPANQKESINIDKKIPTPKNEAKKVPKPPKKKTKNNQKHENATAKALSKEPKPEAAATKSGSSIPTKNIKRKTTQSTGQKIQVQPLVNFKKLVIPFPSNSSLPSGNSLQELNKLVKSLLKQPFYKVFITGFAYSQGNEAANVRLSKFRARAVESYLVGRGLQKSMIVTRGAGSQNPLVQANTASGKMATSRVEIETPH